MMGCICAHSSKSRVIPTDNIAVTPTHPVAVIPTPNKSVAVAVRVQASTKICSNHSFKVASDPLLHMSVLFPTNTASLGKISLSVSTTDEDDPSQQECPQGTIQNSSISSPKDAMKIDRILERLFTFCDSKTLKTCRLVCRQWRDLSLRAWRNKATLNFYPYTYSPSSTGFSWTIYHKLISSVNEDRKRTNPFLHLRKYPFKNFRIPYELVYNMSLEDTQAIFQMARRVIIHGDNLDVKIGRFLLKFDSLEELELNYCGASWERGEAHIMAQLALFNAQFHVLPNMKRLKIFQKFEVFSEVSISNPWKILKCMPNLESLSIFYRTGIEESEAGFQRILRMVKKMRRTGGGDGTKMPLKELKIVDSPKLRYYRPVKMNTLILTIASCDFPLERLTIDVEWNSKETAIFRLLTTYKDKLRYLRTTLHLRYSENNLTTHGTLDENGKHIFESTLKPIPGMHVRMEELREVCLVNGFPWGLYLLAHLDLPKLQKLTVEHHSRTITSPQLQLPFGGKVYDKMETFEFLDTHKIPSPMTIKTFVQMMRNLVHLTIPLDSKTFQIVCEQLKGLKTLHAMAAESRYTGLDDDSFTGFSKKSKDVGPRRPNITDLVHLTDLKICHKEDLQGYDVQFTDHSVTHGLLLLPRLYSLSIAFKELSEDVKSKLQSHVRGHAEIEVVSFTPEYCEVEVSNKYEVGEPEDELFHPTDSEVDGRWRRFRSLELMSLSGGVGIRDEVDTMSSLSLLSLSDSD